jgi:YqaJ-like viral recombinase domain
MSRIIRCTQGDDLWISARVGRVSASNIDALLAPPTTRQSTRKGVVYPAGTEALELAEYRQKLIVERIYGRAVGNVTTSYMKDGSDREPFARMLYEADTQQIVELVGFALHPEWDWFGASPDALCGDDGGVELKCPAEMTHDGYAANIDLLVQEYKGQVLGNLICFPEREFWDLCSFQPYAPDAIKLLKAPRFHRSDWKDTIAEIETKAQELNAQVEEAIAKRGLPPTEWSIMPSEAKEHTRRRVDIDAEMGINDDDAPEWMKEIINAQS